MKLELGDVLQLDGGPVIVAEIKADRARVLPLGDMRGRSAHALKNGIETHCSRDRVLERRGEAGLAVFIADRESDSKHERKGQLKVEPGDRLCYQGAICTVISVSEKSCSIYHPEKKTMFSDERWLNEFFFRDCSCHELIRLTAEEREKNLHDVMAAGLLVSGKKSSPKPKPAPAAKPKKELKPAKEVKSRIGVLFGSSICRVAMTAGAAGVTYDQFVKLLKKKGLSLAESTILQNMRLGQNGKAVGAVLTKEQLNEFKA